MGTHPLLIFLVGFALLLDVSTARAEKRIALIIGNSSYQHSGELENPKNDAQLIASALRRANFEVTVEIDVSLKAMKQAFRTHVAKLKAAGKDSVGFFYFAGHGTQVNGVNYLMPIEANIENESQVEAEAVSASGLMAQLGDAANKMNLVILDSCRNNPFKRGYRAQVRGLAPMHAPPSTLVGYSTQPGNVAYDGANGYSPYAIALHRAIRQPGQSVEASLKQARAEVNEVTDGKQVPWEESSLFVDFYFFKQPPPKPITPLEWNSNAFETEATFWKDIRTSRDIGAIDSYLEKYPQGTFSLLALDRRRSLENMAASKAAEAEKPAQAGVYFFDDFNEGELSKDWDVMNPDIDAYIVEDGFLTVLLSNVEKPTMETIPNVFRLLKPIPKGDWSLTAKIDFLPQTMSEWITIGVMKRDGSGLTTSLQMSTSNYGRDTRVYVRGDKQTRRTSEFSQELHNLAVRDARNISARTAMFRQRIKSIYLRLKKVGRRYTSSVRFDPADNPDPKQTVATEWLDLPKLTSLRVPGDRFTLQFKTTRLDNYLPANTEGLVKVDWVKVEVIE
ncbi:MAG: caspase family protein [Alphaproteobacteria bacterium]|nr:caspase family protein [Alphaproteobacteria bacterium]